MLGTRRHSYLCGNLDGGIMCFISYQLVIYVLCCYVSKYGSLLHSLDKLKKTVFRSNFVSVFRGISFVCFLG